jgi:hypothetical protein
VSCLDKMNIGMADSEGDDDVSSSPESPETIHTGDGPPSSGGLDGLRLRPLPLLARRSFSGGDPLVRPQRQADQITTASEREDSDSDEFSYVDSTDDQSEESNSAALSRDELAEEVSEYLKHSMLEAVYGDSLSGSRTRRYEPKWPVDVEHAEPPLHQPASQGEANRKFRQLFRPLHGWHMLPETVNTAWGARARLQHITSTLVEHRQLRNKKPPPPEKRSGSLLLYRNLPDAAIEVNVWSLINAAHLAIQQEQLYVADRRITKAFSLASKLRYEPLIAKCWYWRGRVADGFGDRRTAADCFLEAMHCNGVYQEGELLSKAVVEYKEDLLQVLQERVDEKGEDKWSQLVGRAIRGIEPWFQPARDLPLHLSYSSSVTTAEEMSPKDVREKNNIHTGNSPGPQSPSEVQIDGFLNQVPGTGELAWYDKRSIRPRNIDWTMVTKMEAEAQKPGYVQKETIYETCQGFSLSFENSIRAEIFTEGFDNYPDLEDSVAWKVLKYSRIKALRRGRPERESLPQNVSKASTSGLTESNAESLAESPTENNDAVIEQPIGSAGAIHRGMPIRIDTSKTDVPVLPVQIHVALVRQVDRVDITAEEKIAAYEQVLRNDEHFDRQRKSRRRLELEEDTPEWRDDINDQRAKFDQFVAQEMAESGIELDHARTLVKQRNRDFLLEVWGPDGSRPPTPSPTRKAREKKRREWHEHRLQRFRAELTWLTYRRKYCTYMRLPVDRRELTAEPIRPSSAIAWLEHEHEKTAVSRGRPPQSSTVTTSGDQASSGTPAVGTNSLPESMGDTADTQGHIAIIPPLRLHQPPVQISNSRLDDDKRSDNDGVARGFNGSLPSDISSKARSDLNRRLGERGSREMIGSVSIDVMTDAMEQARLKKEEITMEQLAQIAEEAISMFVGRASSDGSRPASGDHDADSGDMSGAESFGTELGGSEEDGHSDWEDDDQEGDRQRTLDSTGRARSSHSTGTVSNTDKRVRAFHGNGPGPAPVRQARTSDSTDRGHAQRQASDLGGGGDLEDVDEGEDGDWEDEEEEDETW